MGWTAPKTWSVGELVTAANMNTHVRDNLKYLKGQAGTVAIEAGATFTDTGANHQIGLSSGTINSYIGAHLSSLGVWSVNRNPTSGAFDDTAKSHVQLSLNGSGTSSFFGISTANAANTAATERVRVDGAGKVGIGTTSPQGRLHGYDAIGGFLKWEFDGVDGTARTAIPDGTGDVLYGVTGLVVIRTSGGTLGTIGHINGGVPLAPGSNVNIYNVGGDTVQFQVAANGAVTVQRTAGTLTYKVNLWLLWL